jgi:hypothetical protein
MPKIEYRNADGKSLTGVTTIIGNNNGWNKGALMGWAFNRGKEGKSLRDQEALDVGTIAHNMIEADLKHIPFEVPNVIKSILDKVENSFLAWLEWKDSVGIEIIASEKSLVSENWQYGGSIDVAMVKKVISILDLKTSNDVYVDHRIQIRAYGELWNENYPEKPIQAYYLLRLGKEDGSFAYHYWPSLDKEWEVFKHLLALEELRKQLKG